MIQRRLSMPLEELRRHYDLLGPIEEAVGDRSYAGRCSSFESFLEYGPVFADDLIKGNPVGDVSERYPRLVELVMRVWPSGKSVPQDVGGGRGRNKE